ncbi:MAG: potassium-transporting ATPase subunit KdpA [Chitinophagaceae bacterium]|nr:potassium-transporting ATPase subunit KdpA [Chitinophagaceae bacterium]
MGSEITGIVVAFLIALLIGFPLGIYISNVFSGKKTLTDFLNPVERFIFRFSGVDPKREMNWKENLKALLSINLVWFVYAFVMLITQGSLFLNPDGNPSQSPDLAFNTAISFMVNCDLQHYSGESGLSYLTQVGVISFLMFVSAATGIASAVIFFRALGEKTTQVLGNFYVFFVKSITRILLPLSIVVATILALNGTPTSFDGRDSLVTLQGDTVHVSRGPAAAMVAIKHLGTNGGGWFGANSAHPLENPNYFTNSVELIAQLIIPFAMVFAFGFFINRKKLAYVIFGVMTVGFLALAIPTIINEINGNPAIAALGAQQPNGAMEGKEVRFGPAFSGFWSIVTTVISTGSVNSMHDSSMALSGMMQMLAMMINSFYGGCGVGLLNYFIYIIIAVFISGLMVGRTPEFMGHKLEGREIKIAALITLLSPFLIMTATSLAAYFNANHPQMAWAVQPGSWLNNPSYHGFSEMLYENTSANANNGSGFEGLGDNNIFWNVMTGFVLILGRFLPIIGPVAIAGLLAGKKHIPHSAGTLRTDSLTFGAMTLAVIVIINALSYFPALALGPIAEYFSM